MPYLAKVELLESPKLYLISFKIKTLTYFVFIDSQISSRLNLSCVTANLVFLKKSNFIELNLVKLWQI